MSYVKKQLPFYKDRKGRLVFNPRRGVSIDYGYLFCAERGYRVFFCYHDTPALKNTWGVDSLRKWALALDVSNHTSYQWRAILLQQCDLAARMNLAWEAAGKPPQGVPEIPQTAH